MGDYPEWIELNGERMACRLTAKRLHVHRPEVTVGRSVRSTETLTDLEVSYGTPTEDGEGNSWSWPEVRVRGERYDLPMFIDTAIERRPACSRAVRERLEQVHTHRVRTMRAAKVREARAAAGAVHKYETRVTADALLKAAREGAPQVVLNVRAHAYRTAFARSWREYLDDETLDDLATTREAFPDPVLP